MVRRNIGFVLVRFDGTLVESGPIDLHASGSLHDPLDSRFHWIHWIQVPVEPIATVIGAWKLPHPNCLGKSPG